MGGAGRVPSLDGLRGIAALAVMAFHFDLFFLPQAGLSTIVPLVNRAYLAVDLFFLLSGFVMAHVYGSQLAANRKAHWRGFALARFARLYPLFAIATAAVVALVALCHAPEDGVSFSGQSAGARGAYVATMVFWSELGLSILWSISTEAEAYTFFIFFAGILPEAGKYPRLMIICCILVLVVLSIRGGGNINYFVGVSMRCFEHSPDSVSAFSSIDIICLGTENMRKWSGILAVLFLRLWALSRMDFIAICGFYFLIIYCAHAINLFATLLKSSPFGYAR